MGNEPLKWEIEAVTGLEFSIQYRGDTPHILRMDGGEGRMDGLWLGGHKISETEALKRAMDRIMREYV